jgi:phosphoenolpyruvate carboxylase
MGLSGLNDKELEFVAEVCNLEEDLKSAMRYFNPDVLEILQIPLKFDFIDFEIDEAHKNITAEIIECLRKNEIDMLSDKIVHAARIRKFLG